MMLHARLAVLCLCSLAGASLASETVLGIDGTRFTINDEPVFLLGISYYGGVAAPAEHVRADFEDLAGLGVNWVRVWAAWPSGDENTSALTADGEPREPYLGQLVELVRMADEAGIVVDVSLHRAPDMIEGDGQGLSDADDLCRAGATIAEALSDFDNVYIDMANERDVPDDRYVSHEDLARIHDAIDAADPDRLVTASGVWDGSPQELRGHLQTARVDFICPHLPRAANSPERTEQATRDYFATLEEIGHVVPIHYQEPFRRDYSPWQPEADDFLTDLRGALLGGAAGWCLHNGSPRLDYDGPPRSFDLSPGQPRLMEQLDDVEMTVLRQMADVVAENWEE